MPDGIESVFLYYVATSKVKDPNPAGFLFRSSCVGVMGLWMSEGNTFNELRGEDQYEQLLLYTTTIEKLIL